MKIIKIEKFEEDKIVVTLEEYPYARPVFNSNISEEDLKNELKKWKINQDEVDALNAQTKVVVKSKVVDSKLKAMVGKNLII
jgi:hypothetical protein